MSNLLWGNLHDALISSTQPAISCLKIPETSPAVPCTTVTLRKRASLKTSAEFTPTLCAVQDPNDLNRTHIEPIVRRVKVTCSPLITRLASTEPSQTPSGRVLITALGP